MTRTEVAIVPTPLSRARVSPLPPHREGTPSHCARMFLLRARIKLLEHVLSQWRLVRAGGPARQTGARDTRSAPLMFARCARHSNWIRCCSPRIPEIFCYVPNGHARRNSSGATGPSASSPSIHLRLGWAGVSLFSSCSSASESDEARLREASLVLEIGQIDGWMDGSNLSPDIFISSSREISMILLGNKGD